MNRLAPTLAAGLTVLAGLAAHGQSLPAFPGAEGFGGYALGGRGGDVYTVTNLNSSGAGSLANGIATAPAAGRTIVFAVSGYIHVPGSNLRITQSKITIAGQTAPGDGIGLKDGTFRISGDDIVIRHVRFRHGKNGSGGDCVDLDSGCLNAILDHCSLQFSTDENISSFGSPPENLTMQWSLNGWGLESHSCGGLWDQNHATCHHTLWSHNHTRNPKARPNGLLDWASNVTFDWDIGFIMGDSQTPASWKANVRNSYFLCPPGNLRSKALEKASLDRNGVPNFSLYLNNCRHDNDGDGILNGTDKGHGIVSGSYTTLGAAVASTGAVPVTLDDPTVAFKKIVSNAGALRLDATATRPLRDEVDAKMVANLTSQTRHHIARESDLGVSGAGFGTLASETPPIDTDKDGMPDFWEDAIAAQAGSPQSSANPAWLSKTADDHDKVLPSSGGVILASSFFPANTAAGYTHLEEYLHFLAIPHATLPKNVTGTPSSMQIDLRKFTSGFSASPVFTVAAAVNGSTAQSGTGGALVTFTPTLNFIGRARFNFTVTDAQGHSWTQTCALMVLNSGLPRDLVWRGSGAVWDTATANWRRSATGTNEIFSFGDRVSFTDAGSVQPAVTVTGSLSPSAVDVDSAANYTFSGSGDISTAGVLTKRGSGALTIGHGQVYSGGIALDRGSIRDGVTNFSGGTITMLDGTTFANVQSSDTSTTVNNAVAVPAGHAATWKTGNRQAFRGSLSGAGVFDYVAESTVTRADIYGSTSAFGGTMRFSGSGGVRLFFNGGSFDGFPSATVDLPAPVALTPQTNSGGNPCAIGALSGTSGAAVLAGGTAGAVAYSIGGLGKGTTFAGAIAGNATVTKEGHAALTLTGASTYTGPTTVSAGDLIVNGSLGNTAVTVAGGAKLRGSGSIGGAVKLQAGSQLSPGAASGLVGTLAVGNGLTLEGATLSLQLTSNPAGTNDKITLNGGTLALTGTNPLTIAMPDGFLGAGAYDIVSGGTATSGTVANLTHSLPAGGRQSYALSLGTPGKLQLVVTGSAANLVWKGSVNGTWDVQTTANWLNGAAADTFRTYDAVTFNDSATATTITPSATVAPRSIGIEGTRNFTLGPGLGGDARLTKNGPSTLSLSGPNTYTGGTSLNGGTIALTTEAANNGALGSGPVIFNGGTLTMFDDNGSYSAFSADLIVPTGQSGRLNCDSRVDVGSSLTGGGILNVYAPWVRTTFFGDWSDFTGTINVISDGDGGEFRVGTNYTPAGYGAAAVTLGASVNFTFTGILASGAGTTLEIGTLSGPSTARLYGGPTPGRALTYRIGGRGGDATFSGAIREQDIDTLTAVVKTGSGTWTLGGACIHRGATTVEQGTLRLLNTASVTNDSPLQVRPAASLVLEGGVLSVDSVNIETGATFSGRGTIDGEVVNAGTFTSTGGVLTVTGDVVNDGTLTVTATGPATWKGSLTNNGVLTVNGVALTVEGALENNGTVRLTGGATLNVTGGVTNSGLFDLLTSNATLPAAFDNTGTVVLPTARRIASAQRNGTGFSVTIMGHAGHTFQLQRSTTLGAGWTAAGPALTGADAPLVLTDPSGATALATFYRVLISP